MLMWKYSTWITLGRNAKLSTMWKANDLAKVMQIYTMSSFAVNKCFTLHQRVHAQTHVFKVSVCKGFQRALFVATLCKDALSKGSPLQNSRLSKNKSGAWSKHGSRFPNYFLHIDCICSWIFLQRSYFCIV